MAGALRPGEYPLLGQGEERDQASDGHVRQDGGNAAPAAAGASRAGYDSAPPQRAWQPLPSTGACMRVRVRVRVHVRVRVWAVHHPMDGCGGFAMGL